MHGFRNEFIIANARGGTNRNSLLPSLAAILLAFLSLFILTSVTLSQPQNFIRGIDVSFLDQIENHGGVFKENRISRDALLIFHDHGINYVRLRLWHTPSGGYNNLQRTLLMAERVKQLGMKFLLDLHYSDSWADPGQQSKPAAWTGLSFPYLKDSVYRYTRQVLTAMKVNNTLPDMVQIGNEIICGILWNDGRVCDAHNTPPQWSQFAGLLTEAIRGVRESLTANDTVKIMLHIDRGADSAGSRWFFDNLQMHNVPYDVIGLSYYPWWHGGLDQVAANLQMLSLRYNKDIILVETAYPWTLGWNDTVHNIVGLPSQLLPGYPATVEGQQTFLRDMISLVRATPNNKGVGIFYWSPDYISAPALGSPWENVTLFDFSGEVLSSIHAFELPTDVPSTGEPSVPFILEQNYPNPFNPTTTIKFPIPHSSFVSLKVFDLLGREVGRLVNEEMKPGSYARVFDAGGLASGVYFCRLQAGTFVETRMMLLIR